MLAFLLAALTQASPAPAPVPASAPAAPPQAGPVAKPEEKPAEPKIPDSYRYLVSPTKIAGLGSMGPKESRDVSWEFTNRSDKPLGFRVLDLSPGVTLVGDPFAAPVQPKEVRKVTLHIDATDWVGYQRRAVRIGTDDSSQPNYVLRADMTIRPEVTVDSEKKTYGDVAPYEAPEMVFHFKREGGDPLSVQVDSKLPAYLEAEVVPLSAEQADLKLTLHAKQVPVGKDAALEIIEVGTNAKMEGQKKYTLYLDWRLKLPVEVDPLRVVFLSPGDRSQTLELRSWDKKPFRILRATLDGHGFKLGAVPTEEGPAHKLQVLKTVPKSSREEASGVLEILTSASDQPIRIPVRYSNPAARPAKVAKPAPAPAAEESHGS